MKKMEERNSEGTEAHASIDRQEGTCFMRALCTVVTRQLNRRRVGEAMPRHCHAARTVAAGGAKRAKFSPVSVRTRVCRGRRGIACGRCGNRFHRRQRAHSRALSRSDPGGPRPAAEKAVPFTSVGRPAASWPIDRSIRRTEAKTNKFC
jgi:hypothetical protein